MRCFAQDQQRRFHTTEHSTTLKETYDPKKRVMEQFKYLDQNWVICMDLQMVNFLLGQESGYTKFPCFLFLWESRAQDQHYVRKGQN